MKTLGIAVVLLSFAGAALASATVPEIDGNSAATGVGLLAGAILILRSRHRK